MRTERCNGCCPLGIGLAMLCWASGCSFGPQADYHTLDLIDVSGTVTLDGEPLPGALVTFESPDQTFSYGRTDASGDYQLMLNSEKSGIIPGEKLVRISTTAVAEEDGGEEDGGDEEDPDAEKAAGPEPELVPACYNRESELQVTVSGNDSRFDFDLSSD